MDISLKSLLNYHLLRYKLLAIVYSISFYSFKKFFEGFLKKAEEALLGSRQGMGKRWSDLKGTLNSSSIFNKNL